MTASRMRARVRKDLGVSAARDRDPAGAGDFFCSTNQPVPRCRRPVGRRSAITVEIMAELCHTKGERTEIGEKRIRPASPTDLLDFQDDRPYGLWFALTRRAD